MPTIVLIFVENEPSQINIPALSEADQKLINQRLEGLTYNPFDHSIMALIYELFGFGAILGHSNGVHK